MTDTDRTNNLEHMIRANRLYAILIILKVNTPKLVVPDSFKPTWEGRDWVVAHALMVKEHLLTNPW